MAIEIVDIRSYKMVIFPRFVSVYQRVFIIVRMKIATLGCSKLLE